MAFIRELPLLVLAFMLVLSVAHIQVSEAAGRPQYSHGTAYPLRSQLSAVKFNQAFDVLWGPQHEQVSNDESGITIWLDRTSGSGFKSQRAYDSGYFSAAIKLQAGYTAGVNTAFYLSNNEVHPDSHDEIDIEFLGTIPGQPYTLQTNIYVRAANGGTERIITGREQQIHLWFDPTSDFHRYSILWTPSKIVCFNKIIGGLPFTGLSQVIYPLADCCKLLVAHQIVLNLFMFRVIGNFIRSNGRYGGFMLQYYFMKESVAGKLCLGVRGFITLAAMCGCGSMDVIEGSLVGY